MQSFKRKISFTLALVIVSTLITVAGINPIAAIGYGKTTLQQRNNLDNDAPVIDSVGILKKNISGRVGIASSFIPFYYLGVNKGLPRVIDATKLSGILAFKILDPNGKEIAFKKNYQEIVGVGTITEDNNSRVIQNNPTYGDIVTFLPTAVGNYTIYVWHDFNENTLQDSGETFATETINFLEYSNLSLKISNYGNLVGGFSPDSIGILTKVCLANGAYITNLQPSYDFEGQANPKLMEQISITSNSATEIIDSVSKWSSGIFSMSDDANSASYVLTNENFDNKGCAYINHFNTDTNPGTVTLSFKGAGPNLSTINVSTSNLYLNAATFPISLGNRREVAHANNLNYSFSSQSTNVAPVSGDTPTSLSIYTAVNIATSISIATSTEAGVGTGGSVLARVVDTDGKYTGLKNASFITTFSSAVGAANLTVTKSFVASLAENESYKIYVQGTDSLLGGNITGSVAVTVSTQNKVPKILEGKPLVVRQKSGTTATHYLILKDQFGNALPNTEINTVVTGRNSSTGGYRTYKSSSYGIIDFVSEDKNLESNNMKDLITGVDSLGDKLLGKGLTIDYGPFTPADSIRISGAATDEVLPNKILSYIDTSYAGASNTTVKIKAVLYDSFGNRVPAGIPVSWQVEGLEGKASIYSDKTIGEDWSQTYTDENGEAFTFVYSTAIGDVLIKANSGNLFSGNIGKIHFANSPTDVRVLSVSGGEGYFKVRAEDRYGNPVQNVELSIKRISGVGRIPNRSYYPFTISTDSFGEATFEVTTGNASFKVSTLTENYGQTSSEQGYVGDITISATSVGASSAPKGISEVSIEVVTKDYLIEAANITKTAISAADKATEISNLAAKNAENAYLVTLKTVQKVKTLTDEMINQIALLKKQITSLTIVVNKIKSRLNK